MDHLVDTPVSYSNDIVVTLHRRENHKIMHSWFLAIDEIAAKHPQYNFILPIHPNPNVKKHKELLKHVKVVEPLPHGEFVSLLASARLIITDSGGLQEESSFLRKKCIVCRDFTERVEGMGTFSFTATPDTLWDIFELLINDYIPVGECPYGDGRSSNKIRNILVAEL